MNTSSHRLNDDLSLNIEPGCYTLELLGMIIHTLKILIDDEMKILFLLPLVLSLVAVGGALLIWGLLFPESELAHPFISSLILSIKYNKY